MRVLLFALALTVLAPAARAQTPDSTGIPADSTGNLDATFEALLEDDADGDPTELLELLVDLRDNPLDVNTATADELAQIPALTPLIAGDIVRVRAARGGFTSLPQLREVPGVTAQVYLNARPYLSIGPRLQTAAARNVRFPRAPRPSEIAAGLQYTTTQRVQRRLNEQAGYVIGEGDSTRAFAGSPERIYTRFTAAYRRQFSVNVTLEKDPGEAFAFDTGTNTYGYDYVSAHAAILRSGRIEALVLGDFVAEFGQGVALWRASGFGKGPDAVGGPVRSGRGIRPYGSVDENNFFRGAALSFAVTPGVVATAFASRRARDASLDTLAFDIDDPDLPPDAVDGAVITSLSATGLHRTPGELARKDAIEETLLGGAIEMRRVGRTVQAKVGLVATQAAFDTPLVRGTRPDQIFDFAGSSATTVSVYGEARTRALQAFGEAARGPGGGMGGVLGLGADVGGGTELLLVGRHYDRDFTSLHGYPFGERNGIGRNETGLYAGIRLRPSRQWTVNAYVDQYRFPYLRFTVPRPSQGREALVTAEVRPRSYLRGYIQARTETREVGIDAGNVIPGSTVGGLGDQTRQTLRVQGEWDASRTVRFRARVEGSRSVREAVPGEPRPEATTGALVYQDVRVQARPWLRVDTRLALFRTDDYDSRLYAFENDLTGVFAIPALSGRGVRGYVLAAAEPLPGLVVQAKLASTWLRGVRRVGSGDSEVQGNRVSDVGVQLRYRF
ncbi:MAG TPA: helix-hairpin-helix domain-containing protein [Rubricoccaceae bacterium]|jgi:hypothetical protein